MKEPDHNQWLDLAIEKSAENLDGISGGPFGAVIVKNGRLIAATANKVEELTDPTAHAEIQAIREACKQMNTTDLIGCIIYTSCEPCPMCLGAIYWANIDEVYFATDRKDAQSGGFDDNLIYNELEKPTDKRRIPMKQIKKDKAWKIIEQWTDKNS
ncbi:MAG: nucleoside deaminase [Bacteroidales bacterium]|nr:nucleoside deaminase [Bacteroidales bacterium]